MDYFAQLGHRIEQKWASVDRDEEQFPELAARELESYPPADGLTEQIVSSYLDPRHSAGQQLAAVGAFGEPGITQYYGRGFVIDVYFWNNAVPAIHNHPFCGCFTLLCGYSLHDVYSFEPAERLGAGVLIGELARQQLSLLQPGEVVPFSLVRLPLIHALVHVPNPSVSLVIRTIRTLEYFRFFPPAVALSMTDDSDLVARQIQLLGWMRLAHHPGYASLLQEFLAGADFETTFRLMSASFGSEEFELMIDLARRRHGERADLILPAIDSAVRLQRNNELREQFEDEHSRLVASILMCARDRADVFRLLGQACPDQDPHAALSRFDVFEDDDHASRDTLARLMAGDERNPRWGETIFRALLA